MIIKYSIMWTFPYHLSVTYSWTVFPHVSHVTRRHWEASLFIVIFPLIYYCFLLISQTVYAFLGGT